MSLLELPRINGMTETHYTRVANAMNSTPVFLDSAQALIDCGKDWRKVAALGKVPELAGAFMNLGVPGGIDYMLEITDGFVRTPPNSFSRKKDNTNLLSRHYLEIKHPEKFVAGFMPDQLSADEIERRVERRTARETRYRTKIERKAALKECGLSQSDRLPYEVWRGVEEEARRKVIAERADIIRAEYSERNNNIAIIRPALNETALTTRAVLQAAFGIALQELTAAYRRRDKTNQPDRGIHQEPVQIRDHIQEYEFVWAHKSGKPLTYFPNASSIQDRGDIDLQISKGMAFISASLPHPNATWHQNNWGHDNIGIGARLTVLRSRMGEGYRAVPA